MPEESIAVLRAILAKLPQEMDCDVSGLPVIEPILEELQRHRFIGLQCHPGFNDPAYIGKMRACRPKQKNIERYGICLYVDYNRRSTRWQWKLIKKALAQIGFKYVGGGQSEWFLYLKPTEPEP